MAGPWKDPLFSLICVRRKPVEEEVLRLRLSEVDRSYTTTLARCIITPIFTNLSITYTPHPLPDSSTTYTLLHRYPLFYNARPFLLPSAVEDHHITRYTDLWPCLLQSSTCLSDLPPMLKNDFVNRQTLYPRNKADKRIVQQFLNSETSGLNLTTNWGRYKAIKADFFTDFAATRTTEFPNPWV